MLIFVCVACVLIPKHLKLKWLKFILHCVCCSPLNIEGLSPKDIFLLNLTLKNFFFLPNEINISIEVIGTFFIKRMIFLSSMQLPNHLVEIIKHDRLRYVKYIYIY